MTRKEHSLLEEMRLYRNLQGLSNLRNFIIQKSKIEIQDFRLTKKN